MVLEKTLESPGGDGGVWGVWRIAPLTRGLVVVDVDSLQLERRVTHVASGRVDAMFGRENPCVVGAQWMCSAGLSRGADVPWRGRASWRNLLPQFSDPLEWLFSWPGVISSLCAEQYSPKHSRGTLPLKVHSWICVLPAYPHPSRKSPM